MMMTFKKLIEFNIVQNKFIDREKQKITNSVSIEGELISFLVDDSESFKRGGRIESVILLQQLPVSFGIIVISHC